MRHMLTAGLLLTVVAVPTAGGETALAELRQTYEQARLALVDDALAAVRPIGGEMLHTIEALRGGFSAQRAGVPADRAGEVEAMLPEAGAAAERLEKAENLAAAREAFDRLTRLLVRWRRAAGDEPEVAYCPMEKRSWLQAEDQPIGNPYLGRRMPTCGEMVRP